MFFVKEFQRSHMYFQDSFIAVTPSQPSGKKFFFQVALENSLLKIADRFYVQGVETVVNACQACNENLGKLKKGRMTKHR